MNYKAFLLALGLASAGASAANAQVYVPAPVANGTILGGIAGALIGGHNHNNWAAGGIIGAVAGTIIGEAVEQPRVVYAQPAYAYGYEPVPATAVVANAQVATTAPAAPADPNAPTTTVPTVPNGAVVAAQTAPQVVYVTQAPGYYYPAAYPYGYSYSYGYPYGYYYPVPVFRSVSASAVTTGCGFMAHGGGYPAVIDKFPEGAQSRDRASGARRTFSVAGFFVFRPLRFSRSRRDPRNHLKSRRTICPA